VDKEIDKDVITLTKPVRREDLIGAVTRAVSGEKEATIKLPDEILHAVRPISILLAEDNPTNQMVAKGLMRNLGYEIDVVDQKFYDLILMDVQMPVLDGLQTTQKLRMKVIAPKQPIIIAMTANASEEDKQVCLFSGMNDYLSCLGAITFILSF
jgi:CheY-like chemotaxis protein